MVEIDVQLSADGVPVVIHDTTLDRTTGRSGQVRALPAEVLTKTPLEGTEELLPDLSSALEAGGDALLFDVDVKLPEELPPVAAFLSSHPSRARLILKADVSCQASLDALLDLQSSCGITVIAKTILSEPNQIELLEAIKAAEVAAIELGFKDLTLLQEAVNIGVPITTYTLPDVHCAGLSDALALKDPSAVWGVLAEAGVRAIMTDAAAAAKAFFESAY